MITVLKCLKNVIIVLPSNCLARSRYLFHLSFPHKIIPTTTCLFLLLSLNSLQHAEIPWHRGARSHKPYLWCGLFHATQTKALFSLGHSIVPLHVQPKFTLAFCCCCVPLQDSLKLVSGVTLRDFGWIPLLINVFVSSPGVACFFFQIRDHFLLLWPFCTFSLFLSSIFLPD